MPTRQDVASRAGVSGATVSRVYNQPELVDAATVERVREAAAALGFVPDRHAAALRRKSSSTLLLVEIESDEAYRWPGQRVYQSLYGEIIRGLLHGLQATPWHLQLVTLPNVAAIPTLTEQGDFAGLLGFDVTRQDVADALAATGRPVVCAHHGDHLTGVSTVTTDNREGGRLQAAWLAQQGFGRLGYVTDLTESVRSHALRDEGFAAGARGTGQTPERFRAVGLSEGRRVAGEVAAAWRQGRLQGVACVNDLTALGLIQGLAASGVAVPRDLAVVGYDNLVVTDLLEAGLPTVEARLPAVYTRALEVLVGLVRGTQAETHERLGPVFKSAT